MLPAWSWLANAACASLRWHRKAWIARYIDRQVIAELRSAEVELVCLAGYMRILSGHFIREFRGRILNIHPSLLPAFPGLDAQHQAIAHGVKVLRLHGALCG